MPTDPQENLRLWRLLCALPIILPLLWHWLYFLKFSMYLGVLCFKRVLLHHHKIDTGYISALSALKSPIYCSYNFTLFPIFILYFFEMTPIFSTIFSPWALVTNMMQLNSILQFIVIFLTKPSFVIIALPVSVVLVLFCFIISKNNQSPIYCHQHVVLRHP